MHELEGGGRTGAVVASTAGLIDTAVRYSIVVAQLAAAEVKLRWLGRQVRGTYHYVDGCSRSVDRLAEQMAGLDVDRDTVAEHHQAASVMRGVLAEAEAMADSVEDLSVMFAQASADHVADYGPVADAIHAMPVPMPDASFLSNR